MSAVVRTGLKWVARMSTISALVSAVAALGGPAVAVLVAAVFAPILALCWVLKDPGRSDRLTNMIYACNGTEAPQPAEPVRKECVDSAKPKSLRRAE